MTIGKRSIRELRSQALEKLRGNWGRAILVCFIASMITGFFSYTANMKNIFDFILNGNYTSELSWKQLGEGTATTSILSNIGMLINLLIGGSISYGIYRFFMNLIREDNPQVQNLFSGFKYFGKNFLLQLIIGIFTFMWSIAVYIPAIILMTIIIIIGTSGSPMSYNYISSLQWNIGIVMLVVIILLACAAIIYTITARYSMALLILNDNQKFAVMESIEASKTMMQGHKIRYFLLNISFIGWDILSLITLGIGYLWLRPYKYAARTSFYADLIGNETSKKLGVENQINFNNEIVVIDDEFTEN